MDHDKNKMDRDRNRNSRSYFDPMEVGKEDPILRRPPQPSTSLRRSFGGLSKPLITSSLFDLSSPSLLSSLFLPLFSSPLPAPLFEIISAFKQIPMFIDLLFIAYVDGTGEVNQAGIDHYNKLINSLLAKGVEPYVTLYHWDLPQALEDKYNGWLDHRIIKDYANYAETCFREFGDRVTHWITFNEPHTFAIQGYDVGLQAPGRCSILLRLFCRAGNSATEPYIVGHNVLISHATAADIYRRKYKATQHGSVGIAFDVMWFIPTTNSSEDIEATQRAQDFQFGWFMDPLFFGDYPSSMRTRVGNRLPKFSTAEAALIKGSLDFVGINHYTTYYTEHNSSNLINILLNDTLADSGAISLPFRYGKPIGDKASSIWLYIVPQGFRSLMNYIKQKYGNPPVIITENGMDDPNDPFISVKDALKDDKRIKYHNDYLSNLSAAIRYSLTVCDESIDFRLSLKFHPTISSGPF